MKKLSKLLVIFICILFLCSCSGDKNVADKEKGSEEKTQQLKEDSKDSQIKIGVIQLSEHIALERSFKGFEDTIKNEFPGAEIILKNASGDVTLVPTIVNNFKDENCSLIYAIATPAAQGAKNITKDIPIIFAAVTDPVSSGLVENLEEPEGNVTGVSDYISVKMQLEEFLAVFPDTKKIGILFSTNEANSKFQIEEAEKAAGDFGIEVVSMGVNSVNDVSTAMQSLKGQIDAFYCISDNLVASSAQVISKILIDSKIPSFAAEEGPVENGILLSNGVDYFELGKKAGFMAEEILTGNPVKNVPVFTTGQSSKVVNQKTAECLELSNLEDLLRDGKIIK
ncbi:ABC transporter substrate-binding protein [uncultured Peptoniphilus sp.]|uniref:ABC transporter substrate-binding protein n=1 Tax=uncultured Peptoniphilus sp. TaxID=254354 RepID=UPI002803AA2B|nr:ABC transporter substrate-binding protein [uncultured Peptoniphilus sp.]